MFSPALTDGSLGDMIYFHSFKNPGLVLDIVEGKSTITSIKDRLSSCLSTSSAVVFIIIDLSRRLCFRYSQVERPGGVCQKDRDDHLGRRVGQASYSQCKSYGKFPTHIRVLHLFRDGV